MSKLIFAEGGRKFWPLGGVVNPRQQGGSGGVDWTFQNHSFFSGIPLLYSKPISLPPAGVGPLAHEGVGCQISS